MTCWLKIIFLKQITASLIYPESQLGKEFWQKVYAQAQAKYGTTNIPINTFNKVWIVPEKAVVYENKRNGVCIRKSFEGDVGAGLFISCKNIEYLFPPPQRGRANAVTTLTPSALKSSVRSSSPP